MSSTACAELEQRGRNNEEVQSGLQYDVESMPTVDAIMQNGKTRDVRQAQPPWWSDAGLASRERHDEQPGKQDPPRLHQVEEAELLAARRRTEDIVLPLRVYW